MEEDVLQTVVKEVLDELKEVKRKQFETIKNLVDFKERFDVLQQSIIAVKAGASSVQTDRITTVLNNRLDAIKQVVEAQPKPVIKQVRILFFPENGAREYFKTVGKVSLWLLAFIISSYLLALGKDFINAYSYSTQNALVTSKYKAAWTDLYGSSKKGEKQKMDSVWKRIK